MKFASFIFFCFLLICGCKKEESKIILSTDAEGQWIRRGFDLSNFWNYEGTTIQAPALTDGLHIYSDGTAESFTILFPTDPDGGCKPQKLMYRKGLCQFDADTKKFSIQFTEGRYFEFYQNCTGTGNREVELTPSELEDMAVEGFWKVENSNGKKLLGIAYVSTAGPYLYLEKTTW